MQAVAICLSRPHVTAMVRPPSSRPRPQRLSVNLPENTAEALDKFATRYRVSKSWLLHRLVENGLEQLEKDGAERILFGSSKK